MDQARQDYRKRKEEIENYFKFLTIFDDSDTRLQYKKEGEMITEKMDNQFKIILISNAFLILYNLIESTVRNSIIEVYKRIEDDQISYERLSENLKKIWIAQETDHLKEGNYRPETLRNYIFDFSTNILKNEIVTLSKENLNLSGNIDAEKIRELADKIGFDRSPNGRNLEAIKNKRNRLAHGEQTFYDVGKDFSVKDLFRFKDETFNYLSDVIKKIEVFIFNEKYAVKIL